VSGYIVNSIDEAIDAVRKIEHLDRGTVRRAFEQRFTVECMARRYLAIYDLLLSGKLCGNRMMRPPHRGRPFRLPSTLTRHSAGSLSPEREAARKVAQDAVTNSASVAAHSS
jgi:hypothetical protein